MSAEEAREKLGAPKSKGKQQDFFVFSKTESAQVVYLDGKVRTVSVDYTGADSGAPTPMEVLGVEITPKKNGSYLQTGALPGCGVLGGLQSHRRQVADCEYNDAKNTLTKPLKRGSVNIDRDYADDA